MDGNFKSNFFPEGAGPTESNISENVGKATIKMHLPMHMMPKITTAPYNMHASVSQLTITTTPAVTKDVIVAPSAVQALPVLVNDNKGIERAVLNREIPIKTGPAVVPTKRRLAVAESNQSFENVEPKIKTSTNEKRPIVPLGPYSRPRSSRFPQKGKLKEISPKEFCQLVMPSEDWSVNIYPANCNDIGSKSQSNIFVVSETLLNSDMVEIVHKSITIQSDWGMKFSVMSTDVSNFNIGLDASEVADIQAILDNFDSFPVCSGIQIQTKPNDKLCNSQIMYVDKKFRSVDCPLMLVRSTGDKICKFCRTLKMQNTI